MELDTDSNPRLARTYQMQSIPAVTAFTDGKVVSEFVRDSTVLAQVTSACPACP